MPSVEWLDREAWGAAPLPRLGHVVPHEQFVGLVVHHTVTNAPRNGDVAAIAAHMRHLQTVRPDLGADVPYSFVVFPGPTPDAAIVCEGRGWCRTGAHTAGHNSSRYGIAFAGNFTDHAPTPGMVAAVRWLGSMLADPAGAAATLAHRDTYATACPGDAAMGVLDLLHPPFGTELPTPSEEESDMVGIIHRPHARPGSRDTLDFTWLPEDGRQWGNRACSSTLLVRTTVGASACQVYFDGARRTIALSPDGRPAVVAVERPGLCSVVGPGVIAEAREFWA